MKRSREPEEADPPRQASKSSLGPAAAAAASSTSASSSRPAPESGSYGLAAPAAKFVELDPLASGRDSTDPEEAVMRCHSPPHREALAFRSYDDFETHYKKMHANRCFECDRNFPSGHYLSLHIEECHDPLAAVRRDKGERTFSCFVEDCERKCSTAQKRRMHLIDKHLYPRNFFFAITKAGIDGRRSLLTDGGRGHRRTHSSTGPTKDTPNEPAKESKESNMEVDGGCDGGGGGAAPAPAAAAAAAAPAVEADDRTQSAAGSPPTASHAAKPAKPEPAAGAADTEMEDLAGAMSTLQFVPHSIRFGRGGSRSGFARR